MTLNALEKRWHSLFPKNTSICNLGYGFESIINHYQEPHRYYHNLNHISACLNHLDQFENLDSPQDIELAIWFHDVIYDPLAKDNEEKSAEFAIMTLDNLKFDSVRTEKIAHLVILTKHPSAPTNHDEKALLDIDLSILGSEASLYSDYESWIRQEYKSVPNFLYRKGRRKVLQSFLDQPTIYFTDVFKNKYEEQARKNLHDAIQQL
ncbi:MAG: N-methyl-D-aspartate receptor NMDAR2C subunit [Pseudomonadales bacterium]|nr:N-methyl-D-aspartate receptor NMDAR2C subunit [Pseudomonadales bacterium]